VEHCLEVSFDKGVSERWGNVDFAKFDAGCVGRGDRAPWAVHQGRRGSLLMFERCGLFRIAEILVFITISHSSYSFSFLHLLCVHECAF
jgi:hypothetical protein